MKNNDDQDSSDIGNNKRKREKDSDKQQNNTDPSEQKKSRTDNTKNKRKRESESLVLTSENVKKPREDILTCEITTRFGKATITKNADTFPITRKSVEIKLPLYKVKFNNGRIIDNCTAFKLLEDFKDSPDKIKLISYLEKDEQLIIELDKTLSAKTKNKVAKQLESRKNYNAKAEYIKARIQAATHGYTINPTTSFDIIPESISRRFLETNVDEFEGILGSCVDQFFDKYQLGRTITTRADFIKLHRELVALYKKNQIPFLQDMNMVLTNLAEYQVQGEDSYDSVYNNLQSVPTELIKIITASSYSKFLMGVKEYSQFLSEKITDEYLLILARLWHLEAARRRAGGTINAIGATLLIENLENKSLSNFMAHQNVMSGSDASSKDLDRVLGKTERYAKSMQIINKVLTIDLDKLSPQLKNLKISLLKFLIDLRMQSNYEQSKNTFIEKYSKGKVTSDEHAKEANKRVQRAGFADNFYQLPLLKRSIYRDINDPDKQDDKQIQTIRSLEIPESYQKLQEALEIFLRHYYGLTVTSLVISEETLDTVKIESLNIFDMWLINNVASVAHQILIDEELEKVFVDPTNTENFFLTAIQSNALQQSEPIQSTADKESEIEKRRREKGKQKETEDQLGDASSLRSIATIRAMRDFAHTDSNMRKLLKGISIHPSNPSQTVVKSLSSYAGDNERFNIGQIIHAQIDLPNAGYGNTVEYKKLMYSHTPKDFKKSFKGQGADKKKVGHPLYALWQLEAVEIVRDPGGGFFSLLSYDAVKIEQKNWQLVKIKDKITEDILKNLKGNNILLLEKDGYLTAHFARGSELIKDTADKTLTVDLTNIKAEKKDDEEEKENIDPDHEIIRQALIKAQLHSVPLNAKERTVDYNPMSVREASNNPQERLVIWQKIKDDGISLTGIPGELFDLLATKQDNNLIVDLFLEPIFGMGQTGQSEVLRTREILTESISDPISHTTDLSKHKDLQPVLDEDNKKNNIENETEIAHSEESNVVVETKELDDASKDDKSSDIPIKQLNIIKYWPADKHAKFKFADLKEKIDINNEKMLEKLIEEVEKNRQNYEKVLKLSKVSIDDGISKVDKDERSVIIQFAEDVSLNFLQFEFLQLQAKINKLISNDSVSYLHPHLKPKFIIINDMRAEVEPGVTKGDGWCAMSAAHIINPKESIEELKNNLQNDTVKKYIIQAIFNNCFSAEFLGEEFNIEGKDKDDSSIKDELQALFRRCQDVPTTDLSAWNSAYHAFSNYVNDEEVMKAYLDYIIKARYADSNIAAACLALQGKQLAIFIDYHLHNGRLINATDDDVDLHSENTVCVLFDPSMRQQLAHYSSMQIRVPQLQYRHVQNDNITDIQNILNQVECRLSSVTNSNIVEVVFKEKDVELLKNFQNELMKNGIFGADKRGPRIPNANFGTTHDDDEYIIKLSENEYNLIQNSTSAFNELSQETRINNGFSMRLSEK